MDRRELVAFRQQLRGTALYRLFHREKPLCEACRSMATRSLLYVGITGNPLARLAAHGAAELAPDVTQVRVQWYQSRQLAFEAAMLALQYEKPYYNIAKRYPPRARDRSRAVRTSLYRISCNTEPLCSACRSKGAMRLLFVGVESSPLRGIGAHRRAEWAADVTHITIDCHGTPSGALEAGRLAVEREKPLHGSQLEAAVARRPR